MLEARRLLFARGEIFALDRAVPPEHPFYQERMDINKSRASVPHYDQGGR